MEIANIITSFEKIHSNDTAILIVSNEDKPKIIYANSCYSNLRSLPRNFNLEGRHESELPHPTAEYADAFNTSERIVMQNKKKVTALTTSTFEGETTMTYGEGIPLKNALGQVVACGVTLRKVKLLSGRNLFLKQPEMHATFNAPNAFINDKEWNILYLTLIGFPRNEIAKILKINKAAVNYRIESCLNKTGTSNVQQLIEYAFNQKWDAYIPPYFIQHGHIRLV